MLSLHSIATSSLPQQEKIKQYNNYVDKLIQERNIEALLEFMRHSKFYSKKMKHTKHRSDITPAFHLLLKSLIKTFLHLCQDLV